MLGSRNWFSVAGGFFFINEHKTRMKCGLVWKRWHFAPVKPCNLNLCNKRERKKIIEAPSSSLWAFGLCRLAHFKQQNGEDFNLFACFTVSWIQVKRWLSLVELQKNICNAWTGMLSKAFKIPSHIITSSSSYIIQNGSMSTAVIAKATPQRKRRTGRVRKKGRHKNAEETRKTDTRSEKKERCTADHIIFIHCRCIACNTINQIMRCYCNLQLIHATFNYINSIWISLGSLFPRK